MKTASPILLFLLPSLIQHITLDACWSFSFVSSFSPPVRQGFSKFQRFSKSSVSGCHWLLQLSKADNSHEIDSLQLITAKESIENAVVGHSDVISENLEKILSGKHKWLGGAVDDDKAGDGSVYAIPSHSRHIMCLSPPRTGHLDKQSIQSRTYRVHMLPIPAELIVDRHHPFQWLRGIIANRTLFGIPSWSQSGVLMVDIDAWRHWREQHPEKRIVDEEDFCRRVVSVLPFPREVPAEGQIERTTTIANSPSLLTCIPSRHRWMWHGAALNQNKTAIYCIPSNAKHVLKVDLQTFTTSYITIPLMKSSKKVENSEQDMPTGDIPSLYHHEQLLQCTNKWYGGLLGDDNAIYGIPYAAGSVLRINANDDTISLLGDFGWNRYNWHGGIKSKSGAIYAFPAHSDKVLKIDTREVIFHNEYAAQEEQSRLTLLPIHRAPYDVHPVRKYQWLGGCLGADGCVYGMPSDSSSVLHINVENDMVTTFGLTETSDDWYKNYGHATAKDCVKNKWQGGVLGRDGFIYAIPSNAKTIMRIDSRPQLCETYQHVSSPQFLEKERVTCVGDLPDTKDKWQGAFAVNGGAIYGIPENCNKILEVLPPLPKSTSGQLENYDKHESEIEHNDLVIRML